MLGSSGGARLLCAAGPRLSCWDAGQEAEGPAGCRGWMLTPQKGGGCSSLGHAPEILSFSQRVWFLGEAGTRSCPW